MTPTAVHLSLAAYPGMEFLHAMERAVRERPTEPALGELSLAEVQLCPQNRGLLTLDYLDVLRGMFPETRFRLHANVRVLPNKEITDWSAWDASSPYWQALAAASRHVQAPAYTAHAGRRCDASLSDVIRASREATDLFGCPVGVEGHYPTPGDVFLVSSWEEYRTLFESGAYYVMDLSHLHIVATQSGRRENTLVQEMLANARCLEVHLSGNDGISDQHRTLNIEPWWWPHLRHIHPATTVFSEGTQTAQRPAMGSPAANSTSSHGATHEIH